MTRKIMGIILFLWGLITVLMGISYRIPELLIYFPPHFHPRWALLSTPILLVIYWRFIHKEAQQLINLGINKNKLKEVQNKRFLLILVVSISYVLGIGDQMRFLPHSFHKVSAWISILMIIYQSVELFLPQRKQA